jgi:hypothetical protein
MAPSVKRLFAGWYICLFGWRCKTCDLIVKTEETIPKFMGGAGGKKPPPSPCPNGCKW